jgi:hypothetical protein
LGFAGAFLSLWQVEKGFHDISGDEMRVKKSRRMAEK